MCACVERELVDKPFLIFVGNLQGQMDGTKLPQALSVYWCTAVQLTVSVLQLYKGSYLHLQMQKEGGVNLTKAPG